MKWRELDPVKQSALRCKQVTFWAFLIEERHYNVNDEDDAAVAVRDLCGVTSRAELKDIPAARQRWDYLDSAFQGWRVKEHG